MTKCSCRKTALTAEGREAGKPVCAWTGSECPFEDPSGCETAKALDAIQGPDDSAGV